MGFHLETPLRAGLVGLFCVCVLSGLKHGGIHLQEVADKDGVGFMADDGVDVCIGIAELLKGCVSIKVKAGLIDGHLVVLRGCDG